MNNTNKKNLSKPQQRKSFNNKNNMVSSLNDNEKAFRHLSSIVSSYNPHQEIQWDRFLAAITSKSKNLDSCEIILEYYLTLKDFIDYIKDTYKTNYIEILSTMAIHTDYFFLKANTVLMKVGDKGDRFYIILKGSLAILIIKSEKIYMTEEDYFKYLINLKVFQEEELFLKALHSSYNQTIFPIKDQKLDLIMQISNQSEKKPSRMSLPSNKLLKLNSNLGNNNNDSNSNIAVISNTENLNYRKLSSRGNKRQSTAKPSSFDVMNLTKYSSMPKLNSIEEYINRLQPKKSDSDNPRAKLIDVFFYFKVGTLEKGKKFGEAALENETCRRNATIIAESDTHLAYIGREAYKEFFQDESEKVKKMCINALQTTVLFESFPKRYFEKKYFFMFIQEKIQNGSVIIEQNSSPKEIIISVEGDFEISMKTNFKNLLSIIEYYGGNNKDCSLLKYIKNSYPNKYEAFGDQLSMFKLFIIRNKEIFGLPAFYNVENNKSFYNVESISSKGIIFKMDYRIYNSSVKPIPQVKEGELIKTKEQITMFLDRLIQIRDVNLEGFMRRYGNESETRKIGVSNSNSNSYNNYTGVIINNNGNNGSSFNFSSNILNFKGNNLGSGLASKEEDECFYISNSNTVNDSSNYIGRDNTHYFNDKKNKTKNFNLIGAINTKSGFGLNNDNNSSYRENTLNNTIKEIKENDRNKDTNRTSKNNKRNIKTDAKKKKLDLSKKEIKNNIISKSSLTHLTNNKPNLKSNIKTAHWKEDYNNKKIKINPISNDNEINQIYNNIPISTKSNKSIQSRYSQGNNNNSIKDIYESPVKMASFKIKKHMKKKSLVLKKQNNNDDITTNSIRLKTLSANYNTMSFLFNDIENSDNDNDTNYMKASNPSRIMIKKKSKKDLKISSNQSLSKFKYANTCENINSLSKKQSEYIDNNNNISYFTNNNTNYVTNVNTNANSNTNKNNDYNYTNTKDIRLLSQCTNYSINKSLNFSWIKNNYKHKTSIYYSFKKDLLNKDKTYSSKLRSNSFSYFKSMNRISYNNSSHFIKNIALLFLHFEKLVNTNDSIINENSKKEERSQSMINDVYNTINTAHSNNEDSSGNNNNNNINIKEKLIINEISTFNSNSSNNYKSREIMTINSIKKKNNHTVKKRNSKFNKNRVNKEKLDLVLNTKSEFSSIPYNLKLNYLTNTLSSKDNSNFNLYMSEKNEKKNKVYTSINNTSNKDSLDIIINKIKRKNQDMLLTTPINKENTNLYNQVIMNIQKKQDNIKDNISKNYNQGTYNSNSNSNSNNAFSPNSIMSSIDKLNKNNNKEKKDNKLSLNANSNKFKPSIFKSLDFQTNHQANNINYINTAKNLNSKSPISNYNDFFSINNNLYNKISNKKNNIKENIFLKNENLFNKNNNNYNNSNLSNSITNLSIYNYFHLKEEEIIKEKYENNSNTNNNESKCNKEINTSIINPSEIKSIANKKLISNGNNNYNKFSELDEEIKPNVLYSLALDDLMLQQINKNKIISMSNFNHLQTFSDLSEINSLPYLNTNYNNNYYISNNSNNSSNMLKNNLKINSNMNSKRSLYSSNINRSNKSKESCFNSRAKFLFNKLDFKRVKYENKKENFIKNKENYVSNNNNNNNNKNYDINYNVNFVNHDAKVTNNFLFENSQRSNFSLDSKSHHNNTTSIYNIKGVNKDNYQ